MLSILQELDTYEKENEGRGGYRSVAGYKSERELSGRLASHSNAQRKKLIPLR